MLSLHLLVQGRPVFQSSSIFDLVPCLQSVGISSCLPVCCPSISLCRAGQYFSHPVFSILCHVFSQSVFLHVFLYVVPPSPCAGPASISVIQYFRSCAMSSVSRYFFMSFFMLFLRLFFGRPLLLLPETSSRNDYAVLASRSGETTFVFQESFNRFYVCIFPDVFISSFYNRP